MRSAPPIRYLHRQEIDTEKWDRCVADAPNGWLYARIFFLDGIGDWGGLVLGDYEWVMPLPIKKKLGFWYIYVPPFTGQLGIIGNLPVTAGVTEAFMKAIPPKFALADLLMNEQNAPYSGQGVQRICRTNYILPLEEAYPVIYERYSKDAKKNIRRARTARLTVSADPGIEKVIAFYTVAYGTKNRHISGEGYRRFAQLGRESVERGLGFTIGISGPDKQLLAAAFFGLDNKRIYYILGAPSPRGREIGAIHLLIDRVIEKFAGSGMTFDFEGSDIPSVSYFYSKFSPLVRQYDLLHLNRLPGWLSRLRKLLSHAK